VFTPKEGVVADFVGVEDFGADEVAVAAGEAFTAAAVEVDDTCFVPAGVATETVEGFVEAACALLNAVALLGAVEVEVEGFAEVVDALAVETEDFAAEAALEDFESLAEAEDLDGVAAFSGAADLDGAAEEPLFPAPTFDAPCLSLSLLGAAEEPLFPAPALDEP
jgi:hypothetical protein